MTVARPWLASARVCACPTRRRPSSSSATSSAASAAGRCSELLPAPARATRPTFVVVNGENVAGGLGITPKIADELFAAGVDVITLGNHAYHRNEIYPYLDDAASGSCARPTTCAPSPGTARVVERDGVRLGVVNLSGNVFLRAGRPAFAEIDSVLERLDGKADHVLVDFHAEATSEKVAMGWYLDGRVTASSARTRTSRPPTRASCRAARPTSPTSG